MPQHTPEDPEIRAYAINSPANLTLIAAEISISPGIKGSPDLHSAFTALAAGQTPDDPTAILCLKGMRLVQDDENGVPVLTEMGKSIQKYVPIT